MKNLVRMSILGLLAVIFSVSLLHDAFAQKKDRFSHATAAHKKKDCNSCHLNPTPNWVTARGYPDVADFPGHVACFACHKSDFFAGNKPPICASCHVNPGPKGAARFPFPVKSRSHEFSTIYPHGIHQDVIASLPSKRDVAVAHFVNANFVRAADDPPQFNNCAICHRSTTEAPKFASRIPTLIQPLADAAADVFVPKPGSFKDMPSGHQSCFSCHFQGVKPAGINCAGCHALTAPYNDELTVKRYSLKFDHKQKEHALRDCMTCHVRISQNDDLKTIKSADVPFITCVSCHNHVDDYSKEAAKRIKSVADKQPVFQCSYCHTTDVGRFPIPNSHQNR